ncbi:MAG: PQQ-like beta-propeller repeat protein [Pleurocapsa sp. SU_196_0]|nr:PQQ-like beta-propeller repeat protein [Pleurocapsa sp. SU_196_0]
MNGNGLHSLSTSGNPEWVRTLSAPISSPAIGADGMVYVTQSNATLTAINPDGNLKWTYKNGVTSSLQSPLVTSGRVYAALGTKLAALEPDGTPVWAYEANVPASTPAVGMDGTAYLPAGNQLHAINPNGSRRWLHTANNALIAPAIGADGSALTVSAGQLLSINTESSGLASGWSKLGGNAGNQHRGFSDGQPRRALVFTGKVLLPAALLTDYTVSVTDSSGALLCRSELTGDGAYICGTQTGNTTATNATVTANGPAGNATAEVAIAAADHGSSTVTTRDLGPRKILSVTGSVKRPSGAGLAVSVKLRSTQTALVLVGQSLTNLAANTDLNVTTSNAGQFAFQVLHPLTSTEAHLELRTQDDFGNPGSFEVNTALVENTVVTTEASLEIDHLKIGAVQWVDSSSGGLSVTVGTDGTVYKPNQSQLRRCIPTARVCGSSTPRATSVCLSRLPTD